MKIGMRLILIISLVNLVGIGGLTIFATVLSSSEITNLADMNAKVPKYDFKSATTTININQFYKVNNPWN